MDGVVLTAGKRAGIVHATNAVRSPVRITNIL